MIRRRPTRTRTQPIQVRDRLTTQMTHRAIGSKGGPHQALPTPFEEYMRATYPDATPRQWGLLALKDPEAKRLARESHRG